MTKKKSVKSKKAARVEALPAKAVTAEEAKSVKGGGIIQAQNDMKKAIIANFRV